MKTRLAIFSTALLLFIGCQPTNLELESIGKERLNSVKTITTTFVSHQDDTQQKDYKTVAIANYSPEGNLSDLMQFTSYPYDSDEPKEIEFWANPEKRNLHIVMDGLEFGEGKKNFLYGNDWPKIYADHLDKNGHPSFTGSREFYKDSKPIFRFNSASLPSFIEMRSDFKDTYVFGFTEVFEYDENKVTVVGNRSLISTSFRAEVKAHLASRNISSQPIVNDFKNTTFEYNGDQLISVKDDKKSFFFIYENERLVRTEYFAHGKMYNHREYEYDKFGQKAKTNIFNVNDELEYSIIYDYEYY